MTLLSKNGSVCFAFGEIGNAGQALLSALKAVKKYLRD
jgi:hypothetical protein